MNTVLITGSSGLVGSEASFYYDSIGWRVVGVDNNARATYFGLSGDTRQTLERLTEGTANFSQENIDIRNRAAMLALVKKTRPDAIVHCAAQPAHEWSKLHPLEDFEINTSATVTLLEAARQHCPDSPFVFMSSSKVYGDAVNELEYTETLTRYEADPIDESLRLDRSFHSPYGASKAAADIMVQEFGRCYGMPTVCLRPNCMTGPAHAGVEMHGFLNYLVRASLEGTIYRIFGFKGKQVRDNIHSADVVSAIACCVDDPPMPGEVFNIGGGYDNSVSILEATQRFQTKTEYVDRERSADHRVYVTDTCKFQNMYPGWSITRDLDAIFDEMAGSLAAVA